MVAPTIDGGGTGTRSTSGSSARSPIGTSLGSFPLGSFTLGGGDGNLTLTLTTTLANDIIVVLPYNELNAGASAVASVTSPGLTFARRAQSNDTGNGSLEMWWALATAPLTATVITVAFAGAFDDAGCVAFGVNGCNLAAPWDTNGSLPKIGSFPNAGPISVTGVSTTQTDDLVLFSCGAMAGPGSISLGGGFTDILQVSNSGGVLFCNQMSAGMAVTAAQSSITITTPFSINSFGAPTAGGEVIVDALTANANGPVAHVSFFRGVF